MELETFSMYKEKPVVFNIVHGTDLMKIKVKKDEQILKVKKRFCQAKRLKFSSVKFLIDGERLDDNATVRTLSLNNDNVIEAVLEMSGGGNGRQSVCLMPRFLKP